MFSPTEIADMTFRRRPSTSLSDHSKDLQVFNLLMAIDGKRSVRAIASEDTYELESLTMRVNQLMDLGLIEPVGGYGASIPGHLMEDLTSELSTFIGPMAGVLIDDCAAKMGHATSQIPSAKALSLLDALAGFIQPRAKAEVFKNKMSSRMTKG